MVILFRIDAVGFDAAVSHEGNESRWQIGD